MDGNHFDNLARTLVKSRRGILRTFLGGTLAAVTGLGRETGATATPWAFYRVNQSCKNGEPCGSLAPCSDGVCLPRVCKIDGEIYSPGETEPDNFCHICDPTAGSAGWQQWTTWREGESCALAFEEGCDVFYYHCYAGHCLPVPEPGQTLPGGVTCKHDEQCCNGVCCNDVCCSGGEVCGPFGCMQVPSGGDKS